MEYEYGDSSRGKSFDYYNLYLSLVDQKHKVKLFDFLEEIKKTNKEKMNQKLLDYVVKNNPDVVIFSVYNDEIDPRIIKKITAYTQTICIFYDDTWRISYTQNLAKNFNFFTTPDYFGKKKYELIGLKNFIHFPFGCNENIYQKKNLSKKYDISFVGSWHPYREWVINRLRRLNFSIKVVGNGWPEGTVDHEEMVNIFNQSKINLNLSNSTCWDIRYLISSFRAIVNTIRSPKNCEQLKARHFEINGCGGFQLTYYVQGLEKYYEIGNELDVFIDIDDLERKVLFYLSNPTIRDEVAISGFNRTVNEHLYKYRFNNIFKIMGLLK